MLEENEIKYVKGILGYRLGYNHILGLCFVFFALTMFLILVLTGNIALGSIILVVGVILFLYYAPLYIKPLKKLYDKALEKYLEENLKDASFKYTSYLIQSGFPIKKDRVYFIYDGYYFKIKEDLLNIEEPKKGTTFKYPDLNCNSKNIISFKLQDIISYKKLLNLEEFTPSSYEDLVKLKPDKVTDFRIKLTDFKSINLGNDIYPYFKKIIKEKEE